MSPRGPLLLPFWGTGAVSASAPAGRDEVLAWMAATGMGYRRAAEHFGLPVERVKKWSQRAKEGIASVASPPPAKPPVPQRPPVSPTPDAAPPLMEADEPTSPAERERRLLVAIDARLQRLADPRSIGMRGEQGAAVATGVLIDKLKVLRGLHGLGDSGEDTGRADPGGVLAAMGLPEGRTGG